MFICTITQSLQSLYLLITTKESSFKSICFLIEHEAQNPPMLPTQPHRIELMTKYIVLTFNLPVVQSMILLISNNCWERNQSLTPPITCAEPRKSWENYFLLLYFKSYVNHLRHGYGYTDEWHNAKTLEYNILIKIYWNNFSKIHYYLN